MRRVVKENFLFFQPVHTASYAKLCNGRRGLTPWGGKQIEGLKLTTYLHPIPWLRIRGTPLPLFSTFILGAVLSTGTLSFYFHQV